MRTTRRLMIGGGIAALAVPALPRFARAAEYTWKFGHSAPTSFPLHTRLVEAAAKIAKDSNGRMELQIFPDCAARRRQRPAVAGAQRRHRVLPADRADLLLDSAGDRDQRAGLRLDRLFENMAGDGRRAGQVHPRADHRQGRAGADGADVGPRLPPGDHQHQADHDRRRSRRPEDPRASRPQPGDAVPDLEGGASGIAIPARSIRRCRPISPTPRKTR